MKNNSLFLQWISRILKGRKNWEKKEEEKSKRTEGIIWDLEKNLLVQADNIPKIWKIQ